MEITDIETFLSYWARIRSRTARVIGEIPPEKIEWTYREGRFTLGDLIRHLAALERYMFAENVCGRASAYPGHGEELASGYAATTAFWEKMGEETEELLRSLSDERLQEDCVTPGGARIKVWKWLRAMVEHHVHHRGQIYLYLGMLEVPTSPLYGLTAEEVQERSGPSAL